ncbi:xaa-Pro aminopeptidase 3 isoform X2 [Aethina tumida]|nr:xaa-Pro aminopeptidase 3 isoform X2 [Aethina tumida]
MVSNTECISDSLPKKTFGQPTHYTHPQLMKKDEVTPLITQTEYKTRREKFVQKLVKHIKKNNSVDCRHIVVIPAATKQYMTDKIPYVFRQNSEFLYLTGCQEPDCCLIISLEQNLTSVNSILFTRDKDSHAELWDGPRTYPEDAPEFFGVDAGLPISELDNYFKSFKNYSNNVFIWYDDINPVQNYTHRLVKKLVQEVIRKHCLSPVKFIHDLRMFKSPAEINLMQQSCDIASEAISETIKTSTPGCCESSLFAKVDYESRVRGAEFLAYPPVVAGGERATTIHYINNNQIVQSNELVLMDAGCEFHGYASDITRTWPINGTFNKYQREIYEIVYDAQKELIAYCHNFPSLDVLFEKMCFVLGQNLQRAHLLPKGLPEQQLMRAAYQLCPHHVSHYLGMDVHDTPLVPRSIKLQPGMVITVEPGIYITAKNKNIPSEFHGIGIRIEDDVLITESGPVVLSRKCPKTVEEIEALAGNTTK